MWGQAPLPVNSFYGVEVHETSVPPLFIRMAEGWASLPDDLRSRVEGAEGRHGFEGSYPNRGGDQDVVDAVFPMSRFTVKPVANPHPRTGEVGLYVSAQATLEVLDMEPEAGDALLEELFVHLYDDERVLSHDWHTHDLVVWDNQAVQHARSTVALDGPIRSLRKCTSELVLEPDEQISMPAFSKVDDT